MANNSTTQARTGEKGPTAQPWATALEGAFDRRAGEFKSLWSQWEASERHAIVVENTRSELKAIKFLFDTEQARKNDLQKLADKAKTGPKEHLQFLEATVRDCDSHITTLKHKISGLEDDLKHAGARHKDAAKLRDKAFKSLAKADRKILTALVSSLKKLTDQKAVEPRRVPDAIPAIGSGIDFLSLKRRHVDLHPKEVRAIEAVAKDARPQRLKAVQRLIERGVATQVEKALRVIDKSNLNDRRYYVLNAVLPKILNELIDKKSEDEFAIMARDSAGLATEIMRRLDAHDGPLDKVAEQLTKIAMDERGLVREDQRDGLITYLRTRFNEARV